MPSLALDVLMYLLTGLQPATHIRQVSINPIVLRTEMRKIAMRCQQKATMMFMAMAMKMALAMAMAMNIIVAFC